MDEVSDLGLGDHEYGFIGGSLCLDFVNTVGSHRAHNPREYLTTYCDLVLWGLQAGVVTQDQARAILRGAHEAPAHAEEIRQRAVELREALHSLFTEWVTGGKPDVGAVDALNRELALAMCHTKLVENRQGDGFEWGWNDLGTSLESILWPVASSAADLLTSGEFERVRECAGDTCGWLFLDTTRNHSRRWCEMRDCGNKAKAKRHYERHKAWAASGE